MSYRVVLYGENHEEHFTIEFFATPEEAQEVADRLKQGPEHAGENWIVEKINMN